MKMQVRGLFPVSQMSNAQRITKGTFCNQQYALFGNEFTVPCPNKLEERIKSVTRLTDAVAGAVDGGRTAYNELTAAELEFNELFGAYRDWVNQRDVALGDATKINKLGLDASSKEAQRPSRPAKPVMKELSVVGPGCVRAACGTVSGTAMYTYFVAYGDTEPPLAEFRFLGNYTTPRQELEVTSGKRPWIRMLATNSAGMSEYSEGMGLPVV
jgi:hypothetical protein